MSNFKISVGILSYNCVKEIEQTLESTTKFYPVFVVDGRWKDFKGDSIYSTDGTIELAESYSNIILFQKGNNLEPQNRNEYMIQSGKWRCDAVIILDSDEILELPNGYKSFIQSLERIINRYPNEMGFRISFESKSSGGVSFPCRLILNPGFSRYRDVHNKIYFMDKEILSSSKKLCPNIIINENKSFRSEQREKDMKERNYANPRH